MNLRIRYNNQTIKYKRLFISSGAVMVDSCAAWFLSLPASGRLLSADGLETLSAPCCSQRRRPSRANRRSGVGSSAPDASPFTLPTHAHTAPRLRRAAFSRRAKMRTCENALPPSSPIPAARLRAEFANAKVGKCEKGDGAPGWAYRRWGGRLRFPPRNEKKPPDRRLPGGRVYNLWQARRCYQHLRD